MPPDSSDLARLIDIVVEAVLREIEAENSATKKADAGSMAPIRGRLLEERACARLGD